MQPSRDRPSYQSTYLDPSVAVFWSAIFIAISALLYLPTMF